LPTVSFAQFNLLQFSKFSNLLVSYKPANPCRFSLEGHTGLISDIKLLPLGGVASASYDGTVKIWDSDTGVLVLIL
jgi:WD40 repeat protein